MNPPPAPSDPNQISRAGDKPSSWDWLARELSAEWRGVEPDDDGMPERAATPWLPRTACASPCI